MRHVRALMAALVAVASLAVGCGRPASAPEPSTGGTAAPVRGGTLVVTVRTEPKSFNWYTQRDGTTYLVSVLTQAKLVRLNRATGELEPWLAESWTRSDDGLRFRLKLRPNVTFSDGRPVTADDVVFSFAAVYHPKGGVLLGDSLKVDHKELQIIAIDPSTVDVIFPAAFGPGILLLDNLPILPKHRLAAALESGAFQTAWTPGTPVADVVGAGPFVLSEHVPGQRLTFVRNDRYFRKDGQGTALPYLDRIVVEVVPDPDAQVLRLASGHSDMLKDEIRIEDYAPLKRAADAGRVQLFDLGAALYPDSFWINLKPGAFAGDPRAPWIQRDELRQAISAAVDRRLFADTVFLGEAVPVFGPTTPTNKKWYSERLPSVALDRSRAAQLLATIGLVDANGDGLLEDRAGRPARFTLLTVKGQTALERGAAVIRDELKKVGLVVDVVSLDGNALVDQFTTGKRYDAVYFHFEATSTEPAVNQDFWMSSGTSHVWNIAQRSPATEWERQIDALMRRQAASFDERERRQLFEEVQQIFAAHLPIIHFVAPKVFAAASTRVTNVTPAVERPQLLWAADSIALRP